MMTEIKLLNKIGKAGIDRFDGAKYTLSEDAASPEGVSGSSSCGVHAANTESANALPSTSASALILCFIKLSPLEIGLCYCTTFFRIWQWGWEK